MAGSPPLRNKAFISYSHADKKHLDRLHKQLAPYVRIQKLDVWDDTRIKYSDLWREEIRRAIAYAKVAVLLVSADFLASEFIAHNELPPLLEAAKHEGLQIFQVILSSCAFLQSALSRYQAFNPPEEPLNKMPGWKREKIWAELAAHIADAVKDHQEQQEGDETIKPPIADAPAPVLATGGQKPALNPSEQAGAEADTIRVRDCLSGLTREELRDLFTFLTMGPPDRHVANSRAALLEEIPRIAAGYANVVNEVRRFAEAFELADVLACLSDKH